MQIKSANTHINDFSIVHNGSGLWGVILDAWSWSDNLWKYGLYLDSRVTMISRLRGSSLNGTIDSPFGEVRLQPGREVNFFCRSQPLMGQVRGACTWNVCTAVFGYTIRKRLGRKFFTKKSRWGKRRKECCWNCPPSGFYSDAVGQSLA